MNPCRQVAYEFYHTLSRILFPQMPSSSLLPPGNHDPQQTWMVLRLLHLLTSHLCAVTQVNQEEHLAWGGECTPAVALPESPHTDAFEPSPLQNLVFAFLRQTVGGWTRLSLGIFALSTNQGCHAQMCRLCLVQKAHPEEARGKGRPESVPLAESDISWDYVSGTQGTFDSYVCPEGTPFSTSSTQEEPFFDSSTKGKHSSNFQTSAIWTSINPATSHDRIDLAVISSHVWEQESHLGFSFLDLFQNVVEGLTLRSCSERYFLYPGSSWYSEGGELSIYGHR